MPVISGSVRYLFLRKARGQEEVEHWPPTVKPLEGPKHGVCLSVRLYPDAAGWRAACGDEPVSPDGASEPAMVMTRRTVLGLLSEGKRGRAEVELLGVRVVNAENKGVEFATHIVVAALPGTGLGPRRPVVAPMDELVIGEYVEHGDRAEAQLDLRITPSAYAALPAYLPDNVIERDAERALDEDVYGSRRFTYGENPPRDITVEVESGRVSMHGKAEFFTTGEQAAAALLAAPGVVEVADHLLYLEGLQPLVEQALAAKGLDSIIVLVEHALVILRGEAPDTKTRYRAEDIAKAIPGVRGVVNDIVVTAPATAG